MARAPAGDARHREPFHLDVEDLVPGALRVLSFKGREAMNAVYAFEVLVAAEDADERTMEETLGRPATLLCDGVDPLPQRFHGVIGAVASEGVRERGLPLFRLRIVPKMALLERRFTSRIFQDSTVTQIVDAVLAPHGVRRRWDLARTLPTRVYCVQYHETDLAFVLRMLAEEGIFFRFDHDEVDAGSAGSRELLVLGDAAARVPPIAGRDRLPLREDMAGGALRAEGAYVTTFHSRRVIAATQALLRDYDFVHPRHEQRSLTEPLVRSWPTELDGRLPDATGVYEHKMEYEEPDLEPHDAKRYLEQLRASSTVHEGESGCVRLRPGRTLELAETDSTRLDGRYCLTRVHHEARAPEVAGKDTIYVNRFECVRAEIPFRPPRPERRLRQVTETAAVVGPAGEEIYADPYGRIKVQFHWDLDGKSNEHSSCWMRVSQPWAGPAWGHQFIPRIGMEVIVTFLGGDLDRPLVTGCVYNAINTPSFPIPAEVTRSGIVTRSTPGGEGYNELSFEDAKGSEQIRLRAERNFDEEVVVDHTMIVGRDQSIQVQGNQSNVITGAQSTAVTGGCTLAVEGPLSISTESDRTDVVEGDFSSDVTGNATSRVGGTRIDTVEGEYLLVCEGDLTETIAGNATRHIGTAEVPTIGEVHSYGDYVVSSNRNIRVIADTSITLQCGESSIELTPDGIRLRGRDIRTIATELASMQSSGPSIVASGDIEIAAKEVHIFGEEARLSLTRDATLTGEKTIVVGGGAGLGLAGSATLAGGKVIVATKGSSLVLDADAKLDGANVKLNCGGAGGGVSAEDRDPKQLITPKESPKKPLNLRVLDSAMEPIKGKRYVLTVEGQRFEDVTGGDGELTAEVPEAAAVGQLTVWPEAYPEGPTLRWKVVIHDLPKPNTPAGARVRLTNLAYYVGPPVETIDERLEQSIKQFQSDNELPVTGTLDAMTVVTLMEVHGH